MISSSPILSSSQPSFPFNSLTYSYLQYYSSVSFSTHDQPIMSLGPFPTATTSTTSAIDITSRSTHRPTSSTSVSMPPLTASSMLYSLTNTLSFSSPSVTTQNAGNTGNSMTIIIAAASSGLVLVVLGLILVTLIVIICQAKRKKRESYSVSSEIDDAYNNPTYGTKNILTVTADNHIRAVNPVYEGKKCQEKNQINMFLFQ